MSSPNVFEEIAGLFARLDKAEKERDAYKAIAANLGQSLQLAAMEPVLDDQYREAMRTAYDRQCAAHGIVKEAP